MRSVSYWDIGRDWLSRRGMEMTKWACKNCRSLLQRFEDVNERLNTDCFDLKDELAPPIPD